VPSTLTDSQTFNGYDHRGVLDAPLCPNARAHSGPFVVSRTGDAGCTGRGEKVPNYSLIRNSQKVLVHADSRTVVMEVESR